MVFFRPTGTDDLLHYNLRIMYVSVVIIYISAVIIYVYLISDKICVFLDMVCFRPTGTDDLLHYNLRIMYVSVVCQRREQPQSKTFKTRLQIA